MKPYPQQVEQQMLAFADTLNERDKRRYAAMEAVKLGHGGKSYIAQILGCARSTIDIGVKEITKISEDCPKDNRIRKPGGGRKPYEMTVLGIDEAFLCVISDYAAGDPMRADVRWTNLSQREIARRLEANHGIKVSQTVVGKLLKKHHFGRRKAKKKRR